MAPIRAVLVVVSRSIPGLSFRQNRDFRDSLTAIPMILQGPETDASWCMTCIVILRKMGGVMQKQSSQKGTHLEEAIALLIQTQAAFVAQLAESSRENDRRFTDINRKFAHIEAMLMRHERMLTDLPEVIRQKIGFQPS
jgi:hypothetical protein